MRAHVGGDEGFLDDGNRVKQIAPGNKVTIYVGGLYEATYTNGSLTNTKLYYAFGGQVVAMRDNGTLYYLHGDNPSASLRAGFGQRQFDDE